MCTTSNLMNDDFPVLDKKTAICENKVISQTLLFRARTCVKKIYQLIKVNISLSISVIRIYTTCPLNASGNYTILLAGMWKNTVGGLWQRCIIIRRHGGTIAVCNVELFGSPHFSFSCIVVLLFWRKPCQLSDHYIHDLDGAHYSGFFSRILSSKTDQEDEHYFWLGKVEGIVIVHFHVWYLSYTTSENLMPIEEGKIMSTVR